MRTTVAAALLATCTLTTAPEQGVAQDPPDRLAFERDFFVYPASAGRNPFQPPPDSSAPAPVARDLAVLGIVRTQEPERSVVLLAASGVPPAHTGYASAAAVPRRTVRLRVGAEAGGVRVVEVGPDQVLVVVEEPDGRTRSAALPVPRRRPSGGGS